MAVQEQIYRSSGEVPGATPRPSTNPNVFGAGIGAAVEQAGSVVEQASLRAMRAKKEREDDAANAQAAAGAAQLSIDLSSMAADKREEAPLDGSGHVQAVTGEADAHIAQFLASIPSERVRQRWSARTSDLRGNLIENEDGWARGRRVESIGVNASEARRLRGNALQSNPDHDALDQALKDIDTFWAGARAPADVKDKGAREDKGDAAYNYGHGLNEKDPVAGLAVIESGILDTWISPEQKKGLVNEAQTNIRIAAADARRVQSQAVQQLHEDVTEYKQRVDRGELPGDDVPAGLAARAKTLGETNLVDDLAYTQGKAKLSRETDKWTSADWESHVNTLAAKVSGGKASADEQVTLRVLQDLRGVKEARFRADPEGYAAASGIAVPQVDLANPTPDSVAAKKGWARSFAGTAQLIEPPYLNKDQLAVYRDRANQGPVAQLEVATELGRTWGDAAPSIVRQIGGEPKGNMMVMLGLNPRTAQVYSRGIEALKRPGFKFDDKQAGEIFNTYAAGVPGDLRTPVFDAARAIEAGWMDESGKSEPTADFVDKFRRAMDYATGKRGDGAGATGGFLNWRGQAVWLPPEMAGGEFGRRVTRARAPDWIRAAVDDRGNPTNAVPHHLGPNGKPVPYKVGDAYRFSQGRFVTVAPGVYHLVDPMGGEVRDAKGQPWQFDVRRLP